MPKFAVLIPARIGTPHDDPRLVALVEDELARACSAWQPPVFVAEIGPRTDMPGGWPDDWPHLDPDVRMFRYEAEATPAVV